MLSVGSNKSPDGQRSIWQVVVCADGRATGVAGLGELQQVAAVTVHSCQGAFGIALSKGDYGACRRVDALAGGVGDVGAIWRAGGVCGVRGVGRGVDPKGHGRELIAHFGMEIVFRECIVLEDGFELPELDMRSVLSMRGSASICTLDMHSLVSAYTRLENTRLKLSRISRHRSGLFQALPYSVEVSELSIGTSLVA